MFLSLLTFLACSDYSMTERVEEPAVVPATEADGTEPQASNSSDDVSTDTATTVVEVPVEEDTAEVDNDQPVETDECNGFVINEGFDHYENTASYAIFSLIGDSEIEVRQGDTAKLQFAVTAHKCGDIVFTGLTAVLSVVDYVPADWVTAVEHGGKDSVVTNLSGSAKFEPIDGYNCNGDGYDSQLFYQWEADPVYTSTRGDMDEVTIEAAKTEIFEFDFTPTEYVEPGTTFDLYLYDPEWTDVGTGAEVWDTYYYLPSFDENIVKVRVTIVE